MKLEFRQWRSYVPLALIAFGLVLLSYVGSQYAQMYMEQHRLARQWQTQQQSTVSAKAADRPVSDGLTRLSIPKIKLDAIVVEGTSHHALLLGPGHMKNTAAPGEVGNAVITGHRDTFFRHIYELSKGDVVSVQRDGKTYNYAVTGKRVIKPDDLSVIQPASDKRLTLITCYPIYYIGPAPDRLVVTSKLVDGEASEPPHPNPVSAEIKLRK